MGLGSLLPMVVFSIRGCLKLLTSSVSSSNNVSSPAAASSLPLFACLAAGAVPSFFATISDFALANAIF